MLIVSLTAFEALAVATILPAAIGDIGGVRFYGWAFSSFMLANLVGIQAAGDAADRGGVQRPFIAGCALFATGLVAAGLSRGVVSFIVGRVLQGGGAGALSAASYVAVARGYTETARPRMLAVLTSAWVVPGMIGPAAAGALAHVFGWRSIFLFLIPLVIAALVLATPALRSLAATKNEEPHAPRTGPALRLAVGTGLALAAVEVHPPSLAWMIFAVGAVMALPAVHRLLPAGVLRARAGLPAAVASLAGMSAAFFGAEAYVPLSLTTVRGQSTFMAGVALTAATLCWTAGTWVQERLARSTSHRTLTAVGIVLIIVGVAGTGTMLIADVPIEMGPLMWGIAGFGMGVAYPTATLVALGSAPPGREGEASAAMQLGNVLGMACGTGIGGGLFSLAGTSGYSTAAGIALVDVFSIVAGLLGLAAAARLVGLPRLCAPDTVARKRGATRE